MPKYMLVYKTNEGKCGTLFSDDLYTIQSNKMDMECGLGWYCEVYDRVEKEDEGAEYEFWYS